MSIFNQNIYDNVRTRVIVLHHGMPLTPFGSFGQHLGFVPFIVLSMVRSLALPAVRAQPIALATVAVEFRGRLLLVTGTANLESWNGSTGVVPRRNRSGNALFADCFPPETI